MENKVKRKVNMMEKLGSTKTDIGLIASFLLIMLSLLSIFVFRAFSFNNAVVLFEIINVIFLILTWLDFKFVKSALNKEGYSIVVKKSIPEVFATLNYVLICSIPLPQLFGVKEWCIPLGDIYILVLYIIIMIYLISMSVPFTYSKDYKNNKIGNFYDAFASKKFDIGKLVNIIKSEKALNVLIRPKYFKTNEKIDGKLIIQNLILLKKYDISAYFKLKSKVKLRVNSHFWNLISVAVGLGSIFIALYSRNFFNDLIQGVTKGTDSVKMSNFIFETAISFIFVIVIAMFLKYSAEEMNKGFYEEILMYFEESEKNHK